MLRFLSWILVFLAVVTPYRQASAVGAVLSAPSERAAVVDARYAVALGPAQTTRWMSISVAPARAPFAWLLPVRAGAHVDEVDGAWLAALDRASAARVEVSACDGEVPYLARIEGVSTGEPSVGALQQSLLATPADVRAFATTWGFELSPELESRAESLAGRGFSWLALVYPSGASITRTVRVTDDAFPMVPLFMTVGLAAPVRITAFVIGPRRARLGPGEEIEIAPGEVIGKADGTTDYLARCSQVLMARGGTSWIVESALADMLAIGDLYAPRSADGGVADGARAASGDAANDGGESQRDSGTTRTDDIQLALAGLPKAAWLTRLSGIVPVGQFGDDIGITLTDGPPKSPSLLAQRELPCPPALVIPVPAVTSPPIVGPHRPSEPLPIEPQPGIDGQHTYPPRHSGGGCSCYSSTSSSDSCSSTSSSGGSSSDGCTSDDPGSDGSSDGCGSSDSSGSDDSCDGSGSGSGGGSDGCDGSGSDDSAGDGCGGSGGSSRDDQCAVTRHHHRRRSHTSLFTLVVVAALLPVRRSTRPRRGAPLAS